MSVNLKIDPLRIYIFNFRNWKKSEWKKIAEPHKCGGQHQAYQHAHNENCREKKERKEEKRYLKKQWVKTPPNWWKTITHTRTRISTTPSKIFSKRFMTTCFSEMVESQIQRQKLESIHQFRKYIYYYKWSGTRIMDTNSVSGGISDGNREHVMDTGGKAIWL